MPPVNGQIGATTSWFEYWAIDRIAVSGTYGARSRLA
jgi:hypothetical protein